MDFGKRKFKLDFVEVDLVDRDTKIILTDGKDNVEVKLSSAEVTKLIEELKLIQKEVRVDEGLEAGVLDNELIATKGLKHSIRALELFVFSEYQMIYERKEVDFYRIGAILTSTKNVLKQLLATETSPELESLGAKLSANENTLEKGYTPKEVMQSLQNIGSNLNVLKKLV